MKITDDINKIEIVERLVKDGHVSFTEAIELLKEDLPQVSIPFVQPITDFDYPYTITFNPIWLADPNGTQVTFTN